MSGPSLLVAGIGNVFLGDDAFGVEVVRSLRGRPLPPGVRVVDFGIRGYDLACALADCRAAILVDATARGGAPGTVYVVEPEVPAGPPILEPHGLTPDHVLRWVGAERLPRVLRIVGCEPCRLEGFELSAPARAAVEPAAALVLELVEELLAGEAAPRA